MSGRRITGRYLLRFFNFWVITGAFLIALVLLIVTVLSLLLTRSNTSLHSQITAIFNVTPVSLNAQLETQTPSNSNSTGTPSMPPSPPPGQIVRGVYVQVSDTGGAGLRLRDQPGLSSSVLLLASEAEVFRVDDGPREIDGYTWWYLVGPFDENRKGWAVSNFLKFVQNP